MGGLSRTAHVQAQSESVEGDHYLHETTAPALQARREPRRAAAEQSERCRVCYRQSSSAIGGLLREACSRHERRSSGCGGYRTVGGYSVAALAGLRVVLGHVRGHPHSCRPLGHRPDGLYGPSLRK